MRVRGTSAALLYALHSSNVRRAAVAGDVLLALQFFRDAAGGSCNSESWPKQAALRSPSASWGALTPSQVVSAALVAAEGRATCLSDTASREWRHWTER
jgi:hypothetical protein